MKIDCLCEINITNEFIQFIYDLQSVIEEVISSFHTPQTLNGVWIIYILEKNRRRL